MRMQRLVDAALLGRIFMVLLMVAGGSLVLVRSAVAGVGSGTTCFHGGNKVASACVNGQNGETYFAGFDDFRNVSMTAASSNATNGRHTNQMMWVYTQPDESQWIETGIRQGYWPLCNCTDFVAYWADFNSVGAEFRHTISSTISADGSDHQYEIKRDATNHNYWDVYYDYNFVGQSTNQGSSVACPDPLKSVHLL